MQDYNQATMAKAVGVSLPISMKHSREICEFVKHKSVQKVKLMLDKVQETELAVPFTRFNKNIGHKPGMAAGRYPVKAAAEIKKVVENAEANAQFKGLNVNNLVIVHACAKLAPRPFRFGRQRGRKMRKAHVEIIVQEAEVKKSKKESRLKDNKQVQAQKP